MEIPGSLPPVNATNNSLTSLLKSLQPGQTLAATVTRQLPNGHVELQIGQTRISSQPPLPLSTGQSLQLRVENSSPQQVDLRILNNFQQVDTLGQALRENLPRQAPVARALTQAFQALVENNSARQELPAPVRDAIRQLVSNLPDTRQLSRADNLQQVLQRSGGRLEAQLQQLPAGAVKNETVQSDLKANLVRVIQVLREHAGLQATQHTSSQGQSQVQSQGVTHTLPPQVQATGAQQGLLQAPVSKPDAGSTTNLLDRLLTLLAAGKPATTTPTLTTNTSSQQQGLSGLLSRLPFLGFIKSVPQPQNQQTTTLQSPALRTFINELVMQLESGLARIQSNQLASLPQDENTSRPLLLLDVPVNNNGKLEDLRIRIDREQSGNHDESQHIWRVTLYFDFENLGAIRANISIHNNQVNTTFHSESEDTSEVFSKHLDELQTSLEKAGLKTGHIQSLHIDRVDPEQDNRQQSGFFNDKA